MKQLTGLTLSVVCDVCGARRVLAGGYVAILFNETWPEFPEAIKKLEWCISTDGRHLCPACKPTEPINPNDNPKTDKTNTGG